ncbi:GNAT family N-acetyltransferase [Fontibacter flavus]|uniref:GNAT family N-acetyltransferase n=1 Tax=Fontibacter flavus TaxID=654838 RepID=A0ABV6FV87_9BACT
MDSADHIEIKTLNIDDIIPIRHQVMWPDQPMDFVKIPEDKLGTHYGLFDQGRLTSVVSVFINGQEAQFRKFATLSEEQGKGYGNHLLRHLFSELANKDIDRVWCNARVEKSDFYKKFGMVSTGQTFCKSGMDYVIMEKFLRPNHPKG